MYVYFRRNYGTNFTFIHVYNQERKRKSMNIITEMALKDFYREFVKKHPDLPEVVILVRNDDGSVLVREDIEDIV